MTFEGKIVKAEILWTRKCPLKCHYCNMADGRENDSDFDWIRGIDNLHELGCGFIAFYGAEPLADMQDLHHVIQHAESLGIHTTVITSGCVNNLQHKLDKLAKHGLKSLSMSYDIDPLDQYSRVKSEKAIETLELFKTICPDYRDVAAIATLSRKNFRSLPRAINDLTEKRIWFFFDFIHPDRGQPGAKCKGDGDKLLFTTKKEWNDLGVVLKQVLDMKRMGYLVHVSEIFINRIFDLIADINRGTIKPEYVYNTWHCTTREDLFPSWVTVDCDGRVYCCDDFQMRERHKFFLDTLAENFDNFSWNMKAQATRNCPGCLWNTHLDAHHIKDALVPFSDYVHTKE